MNEDSKQAEKEVQLEAGWKQRLAGEFSKPYMKELRRFVLQEKKQGKMIYPKGQDIFRSFNLAPFDQVRLVILGQDPYHGEGQAHGLCFSVPDDVKLPPSLQNIYKEIHRDLGIENGHSGNLSSWAEQGVLLLNSVLTVEQSQAASHSKKGWETFTDKVIEVLNEEKEHVVFLLWGRYAQEKGSHIDRKKHKVLEASHPSPFSFYRGFSGCGHFSQANQYLKSQSLPEVDWRV